MVVFGRCRKGFTLDEQWDELVLPRRWFSPGYIFLTVFAVFRNGFMVVWHTRKKDTLLKNRETPEQALFIEQEIERFLNIQDRPVRGELPR